MGRVTVYVDDELLAAAEAASPGLNKSAVFQAGLRALSGCEHHELTCTCCGETMTAEAVAGPRLARFFVSINNRFRDRLDRPGYQGAAQLVRQLAADHGIPGVLAEPIPRKTRAEHQRQIDRGRYGSDAVTALPLEADSRRRHPTAQEATA